MGLFDRREKMTAAISVEPKVAAPGQEVVVTIDLGGTIDPELTELEAGITCEGSWDTIGDPSDAVRDRHFVFHRDLRPVTVGLGQQVLRCTIPADAPPTAYMYTSHHTRWVAVVRGRGKRLLHAAQPFPVTADPERCRPRESLPATTSGTDAVTLAFDARRTMWTGWPYEGTLHLTAQRPVELKDVVVSLRAQLVWSESEEGEGWDAGTPVGDPRGRIRQKGIRGGYKHKVAIDGPLAAGETRAIPFSLTPHPDGMYPTFSHPLARTHWLLVGEAEVKGEDDATTQLELNVASQPADDYR